MMFSQWFGKWDSVETCYIVQLAGLVPEWVMGANQGSISKGYSILHGSLTWWQYKFDLLQVFNIVFNVVFMLQSTFQFPKVPFNNSV